MSLIRHIKACFRCIQLNVILHHLGVLANISQEVRYPTFPSNIKFCWLSLKQRHADPPLSSTASSPTVAAQSSEMYAITIF